MAQPATNPKIEELRSKLKTDPKSRLFFPLAEELRKAGQLGEAEQVLRTGLTGHAGYLSAWVSLGRVLKDQHKERDAIEPLSKAMAIDPGNLVVARLLAETYLALGEKVEAIKKYKLLYALLPGDEETEAIINRLDSEINHPKVAVADAGPPPVAPPAPAAPPPPAMQAAPAPPPPPPQAAPPPPSGWQSSPLPEPAWKSEPPAPPVAEADDNVFDVTYSRLKRQAEMAAQTGDAEPMAAAHAESPFEEAAAGSYGSDAFSIEAPPGMHMATAPFDAEVPLELRGEPLPVEGENALPQESADDADIYEPTGEVAPGFIQGRFDANVPPPPPSTEDFAKTILMADLYANQGLVDEARDIYEDILARDPDNISVQQKLAALSSAPAPAPAQDWPDEELEEDQEPVPEALPAVPAQPRISEQPKISEQPVIAVEPVVSAPPAPSEPEPAEPVSPEPNAKVGKLEKWLSKVKRTEVGGV